MICGPMFAGKSEELLRKLKRLEYADVSYIVFKPKIDTRSRNLIESRNGKAIKAIEFDSPYEILDYVLKNVSHPQVVAIDEAQFASIELVEICDFLANSGVIMYISGLDKNFKNEPFEVIAKLCSYAEHVIKLSAVCTECGAPGTTTQRIVDNKPASYYLPIIQVDDRESYSVKCRHHHSVPKKPIDQRLVTFLKDYKKK
ncbi:MAG: thymidine kinase [Bacilli bacterium]